MKKNFLKIGLVLAALLLIAAVPVFAHDGTWTGVVADILCIDEGFAFDGADMAKNPEKHTTKCALMKPCIDSGYAVLVENSSGGFNVYPLNAKGNKLALDYFENTGKKDDHVLTVTGTLLSDETIEVKRLKEAM